MLHRQILLDALVADTGRYFVSVAEIAGLAEQYRMLANRIQTQKQLLDSINGTISEFIGLKAPDGSYRYVNPAFAEAVARKPESMVGLDDAAVFGRGTAKRLELWLTIGLGVLLIHSGRYEEAAAELAEPERWIAMSAAKMVQDEADRLLPARSRHPDPAPIRKWTPISFVSQISRHARNRRTTNDQISMDIKKYQAITR